MSDLRAELISWLLEGDIDAAANVGRLLVNGFEVVDRDQPFTSARYGEPRDGGSPAW